MKRRHFFATLFAPILARFAPKAALSFKRESFLPADYLVAYKSGGHLFYKNFPEGRIALKSEWDDPIYMRLSRLPSRSEYEEARDHLERL